MAFKIYEPWQPSNPIWLYTNAGLKATLFGSAAVLAKSLGQNAVDEATRIEHRGASLRTVCEHVLRAAGVVRSGSSAEAGEHRRVLEVSSLPAEFHG